MKLESCDGQIWEDLFKDCAPCHILNIDGILDTTLSVILASLKCMLCREAQGVATMVLCNVC